MYVYRSPLCDCVHESGQHQLGQGERSLKGVLLSPLHKQTWLVTHHRLSCSQLCSRALSLRWETKKRYSRTIPGPLAIGLSGNWTSDPHHTSRRNHQILNFPEGPIHCKLWVCFFDWELEGTGVVNTASAHYHFTNSELSSKARLAYACITGYTTTPTLPEMMLTSLS